MRRVYIVLICVCAGTLASFSSSLLTYAQEKNSEVITADLIKEYKRPETIPENPENRFSEAKKELGLKLFFDPRFSRNNLMSCATCHNPSLGWEDGRRKALGHKGDDLNRHTPTLLNLAWSPHFFWDGRASSLEEQAKMPILNMSEMGMTEGEITQRLHDIKGYQPLFEKAFPGEAVTLGTIGKALAVFERSIISERTRFDYWIEGDQAALTESEKRGFLLFNTKARCAICHTGWRFTDDGFHDIGLKSEDIGRGEVVKDVSSLKHAFKTPTLSNISKRAPYMHDGSLKTLDDVIRHYEHGFVKRESLSWAMQPFSLSDQERADLISFLNALSSEEKMQVPQLPN